MARLLALTTALLLSLLAIEPAAAQHPITSLTSPGILSLNGVSAVAPDGSFAVAGQTVDERARGALSAGTDASGRHPRAAARGGCARPRPARPSPS